MDKLLKLYTYVDGVNDTPFPNESEQIIFGSFTYEANRMGGSPTITATVKHRLCLDDYWSDKVYASFRGEKYFVKTTPSSLKNNDDARYEHSVELLSERELLNHVYFIDAVQGDSSIDIYKSNSTTVVFFGDITEFVARLNASLSYFGLDYNVVIDEGITSEEKQVTITDKYFLSALQEIFNIYELPYYFVGKTIHIGFTENAITFPMAYGSNGALLSISKENANYQIINSITGVGSTDNIPYYYPNESDDRDKVTASGKKWITPQANLMPPIYRESEGADMFYEAKNNTYPDPEGGYYEFENEYSEDNPQQGKVSFPEIKPTIKGMTNAAGQRIDTFIEFAYDRDDNEDFDPDNNNEYLHPYFFAKLRKTDGPNGFNLFDHAIENQAMQISMTSGICGACTFEIGVGEETQKNIVQVDDNGNLKRDEKGNVIRSGEPQDRQNNTQTNEVWLALKKDDSTYAQLMPNKEYNYRPSSNDTFVILGISLPQGYITRAEQELKDTLIKHMWMNNREKFNFSIKFSRIFFTEHPDVLEQLNENARLLVEYNNQQFTFYVDKFSYKMDSDTPLPEVSVDLVETLTVGQNSLQNALDSVKQDILSSIGGSADFLKQGLKYFIRKDINDYVRGITTFLNGLRIQGKYISDIIMSPEPLEEEDDVIMSVLKSVNTFLRKDKADATNFLLKLVGGAEFGKYESGKSGGKVDANGAAEFLSLLVRGLVTAAGIESADFSTGVLGTGFTLKKDENGDSYLEVDRMLVRKIATFVQLLIQKIRAVGGQIILSPATMNCSRVEEHDTFYRCYFENTDGEKTIAQEFVEGDQARCQTFNVKEGLNENVSNTYYWRLVVGVGDDYIDLSKTDCDAGSTIPQAGDDIVQLGNRTDATRQAAIVLAAYGNDAPYFKMYRGINSYSMSGKEFISFSRTEVMIIADSLRFSTGESVKDYIDGATGNAITGVDVEYALSDSPTEAPKTGWSTTAPEWQAGKYMWQRTKTTTSKGTSYSDPTCIQGAKGEDGADGVPGEPGADGKTLYTWIRYADTSTGEGISNDPTGKAFIGFAYNKNTATESNVPSDYIWSEIKGEQGVPGVSGEDGKTLYTWIAYSDNANGTPMYQQPTSTTQYIGIATNKESATESNNPSDYTWSKFKGDKGDKGDQGLQGLQGEKGEQGIPGSPGKTLYTWIRYADDAQGTGISNDPTGKKFIGFAYNKETATESNNPADYTWSDIKGEQGVKGDKGEDGTQYYTWIKYSDNADGSGMYDTPKSTTQYIGIAVNKTSSTESNTPTDYVWSKFKGDKGDQGPQGIPGADGADGRTSYFHIKYSSKANPTSSADMTETPSEYIGTYVDYTAADSTDPKKYTWSRFQGIQGEKGDQGIPGSNGLDGKTYYLHIAYANSADGSQGFSTTDSTNKLYIGQYTDTTQADSTDYKKYSWTKIKGDTGKGVSALEEQYYLSTSNTTQTGGTWQTTCPAWENGKYIWTRTKVTWTDSTVTYTTPVLAEYINDLGEKLEQAISDLAENIDFVNSLSDELDTVKDQVDGAIETWFYSPVPTLTNAPASSWTTTELKNQHLGDLYYDGNGKAYRFQMSGSNYVWQVITDTDITKALANAQKAQDTADGKRRVFVTTPTNASAYDVGDLWVNATYGSYSNDLLRCKTAKAAGAAWNISHWEKASKYTDDTKANQAIEDAASALAAANNAQSTATAAKNRLDGWAADNVISPTEKQGLKDEIARIDGDKSEITANYTKYGLGTPTAYNNAHSAYRAVLVTLSAATPETIAIPSDFATKQTAYYTARTNALTAIATAAKDYADEVVDNLQIGGRNYILNTTGSYSFTPTSQSNFNRQGGWVIKKEAATIGECVFACKVKFENCTFSDNSAFIIQTLNSNGWDWQALSLITKVKENKEYIVYNEFSLNRSNVTGNSNIQIRVDYVGGGTITVSEMRLYKGAKDIGWTPAPEDADNALNAYKEEVEAEFTATKESITAAVNSSKQYTDEKGESILTQTSSMINTAKDEINLSVETKINGIQGSITELSSRIDVTEESIKNTVTKTEFNSLSGTVSNHTSQITQLNNQIKSVVTSSELEQTRTEILNTAANTAQQKADQAKADAIADAAKKYVTTTTYNNKMSSIDQTLSSITSRVSSTETSINTINGSLQSITQRVSAAELKITPDAINATVSEQTKQIADEAVKDLELGGRNYFGFNKGVGFYIMSNTGGQNNMDQSIHGVTMKTAKVLSSGTIIGRFQNLNLPENGWYTFSAWMKATTACKIVVDICDVNNVLFSLTTEYQYVTLSSNVSNHITNDSYKGFVDFTVSGSLASGVTIYVKDIKVEKGTKATDWTPAPEDYSTTSEIKSSFTMTSSGISLLGQNISLTGKVTFSMFATDAQNKVTTAQSTADSANTAAKNAQTTATNAQNTATSAQNKANSVDSALSSLKNDLGDLAYKDKVSTALLDTTIISGGYIKTSLIDVDNLYVKHLEGADGVFKGSLQAATGSFSGEITANSGTIGGWTISETKLQSENYKYPTGDDLTGGEGSFLQKDGIMINCLETNGVLMSSVGMSLGMYINVTNRLAAGVFGAYIKAESTSSYGYLNDVVALELSAKNSYVNPQTPPLAIKVTNGICDFKGIYNLSFGKLNAIMIDNRLSNVDVYGFTYSDERYAGTGSGTTIVRPANDYYVNLIRLMGVGKYTLNVCGTSEAQQMVAIVNESSASKYISMTRGSDHWTYELKSYNGCIVYVVPAQYSYGGYAVNDLFILGAI